MHHRLLRNNSIMSRATTAATVERHNRREKQPSLRRKRNGASRAGTAAVTVLLVVTTAASLLLPTSAYGFEGGHGIQLSLRPGNDSPDVDQDSTGSAERDQDGGSSSSRAGSAAETAKIVLLSVAMVSFFVLAGVCACCSNRAHDSASDRQQKEQQKADAATRKRLVAELLARIKESGVSKVVSESDIVSSPCSERIEKGVEDPGAPPADDDGTPGTALSTGGIGAEEGDFSNMVTIDLGRGNECCETDLESAGSVGENGDDCGADDDNDDDEYYLQVTPQRRVRNLCAICLNSYQAGDKVVWSQRCPHAFHTDCMVNWYSSDLKRQQKKVKQQEIKPTISCPCCRQEFLNLSNPDTSHQELVEV